MCFEELGKHFRVIAVDHRGHGRGIKTSQSFRLSDCADDIAALADQLGIHTFIPVGYSMGGLIAQLMWKRHEHRVRGLVLAATSGHFIASRNERILFTALTALGGAARIVPQPVQNWISEKLFLSRKAVSWDPWAIQQQSIHQWRQVLEAGAALGNFDSRGWLPRVNVPTSVIITTKDEVVATSRQRELASLIPESRTFEIEGNHDSVFARADKFVPLLVSACIAVNTDAVERAEAH